jgi:hypothetical protein
MLLYSTKCSVVAGLLLNGVQATAPDDVYVCGTNAGFEENDIPHDNVDGHYTKVSDSLWSNADGSRVITDLGFGGMEGCNAVNQVADANCYPFNRWSHFSYALRAQQDNVYHWDGFFFGALQYTPCGEEIIECADGYHANADGDACEDNDECGDDNYTNNCHDGDNTVCNNTDGSFECLCAPELGDGYKMGGTKWSRECVDVDECKFGNINSCSTNGLTECNNTVGSYTCDCKAEYNNEFFANSDDFTCSNVDECTSGTNDCSENAMCTDNTGATEGYSCACYDGFLDEDESNAGRTCTDIDECAADHDCHDNATCTNTAGAYECYCKEPGYTGDGRDCNDIDECATEIDECDDLGTCTNHDGHYTCMCPDGYDTTDEGQLGYKCEGIQINKGLFR